MADIPEHLLQRSKDRKATLEGGSTDAAKTPEAPATPPAPVETAPVVEAAPVESTKDVVTKSGSKIPASLLQRTKNRKSKLSGESAPSAATQGAPLTQVAMNDGPEGHNHRLLTVVKSGSIQQKKASTQDKVHTWPHLLSIELVALLSALTGLVIMAVFVKAPLLSLADFNQTPNPAKAPWYFLGLQELLTMFHPMVAGVTLPGVVIVLLAITPYFDKNKSIDPQKRKFAIVMMVIFVLFWAILVIIGSFFRGQGFNFVFPWNDGVYFES